MDEQVNNLDWEPITIASGVAKSPKSILSAEEYNAILNGLIEQGNNNVTGVSTVIDTYARQLASKPMGDIVQSQLTALQNQVADKAYQEKSLIYLDAPKAMLNVLVQGTRTSLLECLALIRQHAQAMGINIGITVAIDPMAINQFGCITTRDLVSICKDPSITLGILLSAFGADIVEYFRTMLAQLTHILRSESIQKDLFPLVVAVPPSSTALGIARINDLRRVATVVQSANGNPPYTDSAKFVQNGVLYAEYISAYTYDETVYRKRVIDLKQTTDILTLAYNADMGFTRADTEKLLHVIDMCYDDTLVPKDAGQRVTPVIIPNSIHHNIATLLNTVYTQAEALKQIAVLQQFATKVYADTQTALQEELVKLTGSCTQLSGQLKSLEDQVTALEHPSTPSATPST